MWLRRRPLQGPFVEALMREVEVLGRCNHPCVVKLMAACLTDTS
jgi:hypothetical protein